MNPEDIVERLRKRAEIRRQIPSRKSVQEGQPDRIADFDPTGSWTVRFVPGRGNGHIRVVVAQPGLNLV